MENKIQTFENSGFGKVHNIVKGEPWFSGKDVSSFLDYTIINKSPLDYLPDIIEFGTAWQKAH